MKDIQSRVITFANYIINEKKTLRQTAKIFGYSKSTVHNDVSKKLIKINKKLYEDVKKILEINFKEKHIRGGQSTKNKYSKLNINTIAK